MNYKNHNDGKSNSQILDYSKAPWIETLMSKEESGKVLDQYAGTEDSSQMPWMKTLLVNIEDSNRDLDQYKGVLELRKDSILTPYGCKELGLVSIDPTGKSNYVKKSA